MWPQSMIGPYTILIPTLATTRPHLALKPCLYIFGESVLSVWLGLDIAQTLFGKPLYEFSDITHLCLDHDDYRIMT